MQLSGGNIQYSKHPYGELIERKMHVILSYGCQINIKEIIGVILMAFLKVNLMKDWPQPRMEAHA